MIKKCLVTLLLISLLCSCKNEEITSVQSYTYNELKPLLEKNDGKTYVINFWATWCAPCVKELPAFEKINKEYVAKNVTVILVSLDFPKQVAKRLIPFINKKKLQSKVVLLNDINENFWIKAIDSSWSGAIPATIIYNGKDRKFYEQSFDYDQLETELQPFL
ncbi:TlpA family protein disulfide reductase [Polaribacter sp.]|nr:TlpA family protein disulfide reductase [Polaribacter sp.]